MLFDIGIDIEKITNFCNLSNSFLENNFTSLEIDYCKSKTFPELHFASIFSAKEALLKTLNKNFILLKDIELKHNIKGKPSIFVEGIKDYNFLLSISHKEDIVVSVVLKVKNGVNFI